MVTDWGCGTLPRVPRNQESRVEFGELLALGSEASTPSWDLIGEPHFTLFEGTLVPGKFCGMASDWERGVRFFLRNEGGQCGKFDAVLAAVAER
jgi:hypothetical protein